MCFLFVRPFTIILSQFVGIIDLMNNGRHRVDFLVIQALTFLALLLASCKKAAPPSITAPAPLTQEPTLAQTPPFTPTPFQPSPTPVPLAALVNGEPVTLDEYQAELGRYKAALGTELATEDQQRVLDELVGEVLLAQAAREAGYNPSEADLQQRYDDLATGLGSPQALKDWMGANGYTEESFRRALARSVAAAWMRDQITTAVPPTGLQVHARQILLYNSEEADGVLAQLRGGADFAELATQYDPTAGGDLGWFPAGYLLDARLDEAAFSLQPGEYSEVIQTAAGYHILQVLERDPQRPLDPGTRQALQLRALQDWMTERRNQSQVQVFLP